MLFGPPKDVEGECNAHLYIGDDYGDNSATIRCQLEANHEEKLHKETFNRDGGVVTITWEKDEKRSWDDEDEDDD